MHSAIKSALLAGVLAMQMAAAQAAPSIRVDANPVKIPDGSNAGSAVITWDAEDNKDAEVWLKVENGDETRFSGDSKGAETAIIRPDRKYTFTLYSMIRRIGPLKNPLAKALASVEVSGIRSNPAPGSNPAPDSGSRPPDRTLPGTPVPAEWPGAVKFPAPPPRADARYAPTYLYAVRPDGLLGWYRHDGANVGVFKWQEPRLLNRKFGPWRHVFGGDGGDIYTVSQEGVLQLHPHVGFQTGLNVDNANGWGPTQDLGTGWGNYKQAFAGGGGVIYAIAQSGDLLWYKNGANGLEGPKVAGGGWGNFKQVFSAGRGLLYALTHDGKLMWYKHTGHATGEMSWLEPKVVATDWGSYPHIFGAGRQTTGNPAVDGATMYLITQDGKLLWRKHRGFRDGTNLWGAHKEVGSGWGNFQHAFALLSATPSDQSRAYDPNAPKTLNLNPYIKDVRVRSGVRDVAISFASTQTQPAVIEIGTAQPIRDRHGVLTFPSSDGAFSRLVAKQGDRYTLDFSVAADQLEPKKTYFYIIKVFNNAATDPTRKLDQYSSQFTTQNQSVRVYWESVHISNDSDPNGSGELYFEFFMNHGDAGAQKFENFSKDLPDGRTHNIGKTIVIHQAPDLLTLAVNGQDDDADFAFVGITGSPYNGPYMTDDGEFNVAKDKIDLTQFPGNERRVQFELRSMPNGGNLGDLQFEVRGYIIITRG